MSLETEIGVILLAINIPFGWFGLVWFGYCGKKTGRKIYYFLSGLTYAVSWLMLAGGIYLCGKDYADYIINDYVIKFVYPFLAAAMICLFAVALVRRKKKNAVYKK